MKLRARDVLLLIVAWVFAAIALAVLFVALRSRSLGPTEAAKPDPTYTVVFTQVTARGLFPAAEGLALAWQPDAQLVSLTADWRDTAVNRVGEPGEWIFRFYSPAQRRSYFVSVEPDGQPQGIEHARKVDLPPPVIPIEAWRVDSVDALATWLDYGGGGMLGAKPGIEVSAQLNLPNQEENLVWTVVGFDTSTNDYLTVIIDANSGKVVQTVKP